MMDDLTLCKKIAEIEGVILGCDGEPLLDGMYIVDSAWTYYNPLNNKALIFDLMVKHKVEIDWYDNQVDIYKHQPGYTHETVAQSNFDKDEEIPRAILECIIAANG